MRSIVLALSKNCIHVRMRHDERRSAKSLYNFMIVTLNYVFSTISNRTSFFSLYTIRLQQNINFEEYLVGLGQGGES